MVVMPPETRGGLCNLQFHKTIADSHSKDRGEKENPHRLCPADEGLLGKAYPLRIETYFKVGN